MGAMKTGMLLAAMTALFMAVGYVIGGGTGMVLALGFAVATNAFAYWNSDKLALRMHGAQPVTAMSAPDLHAMTERLARNAGLPMPKLYVINSPQPNAFATGRNPENAAVAVTMGLIRGLPQDEIEGVIAHELAHIRNRDTLIMTVAATVAGAISMLAQLGFWMGGHRERGQFGIVGVLLATFLAPIAAALIQMTISRTREYAADRAGAEISGNPLGLANALRRISRAAASTPMATAEVNPSSAHLFIANPLSGMRLDRLFATHPPMELRVAALEEMARTGGYRPPQGVRLRTVESSIPRVPRR